MTEIKCYDCGKHADVVMLQDALDRCYKFSLCINCFISDHAPSEDIPTYVNGRDAVVRTIIEEDLERTVAENYFTKRMEDPEYAAAYHVVRAKLEKNSD